MTQVVHARRALVEPERLFAFLTRDDPAAERSATVIAHAIAMLADHPLIGRARRGELRGLVISFGKTGYVALYRFVPHADEGRVLAIRHQRELDHPH